MSAGPTIAIRPKVVMIRAACVSHGVRRSRAAVKARVSMDNECPDVTAIVSAMNSAVPSTAIAISTHWTRTFTAGTLRTPGRRDQFRRRSRSQSHEPNHMSYHHLPRRLRRWSEPGPRQPTWRRRHASAQMDVHGAPLRRGCPRAGGPRGAPRRVRDGPQHVRSDPRRVGRGVERLVGRRAAVSLSGVRPHPPRPRPDRDGRRNDVSLRHRGFDAAYTQARAAAGDEDVAIAGGAATVRQAFAAGVLDEITLDIAPVLLGAGERLFDGVKDPGLEPVEVTQSPLATHIRYRVGR